MGFFKDAFKSIGNALGNAVKGIAKGVKKVAKAVVTSTPLGQKLWKKGGELMTKVGKGLSKLGPVGMLALNFVIPGIGGAIGGLLSSAWGAFGAGAATWATSANAVISTLGKAGSYIFDAGNFVSSTVGSFGDAVSKGSDRLMSGDFSGAVSEFSANVKAGFSGKAGMAGVDAGRLSATSGLPKSAELSQAYSEGTLGQDNDKLMSQLDKYDTGLRADPNYKDYIELTDQEKFMSSLDNPMSSDTSLLGTKELNYQQSFVDPEMALGKQAGQMDMQDWDAYFNYGGQGAVQQLNTIKQIKPKAYQREDEQTQSQGTSGAMPSKSLLGSYTGATKAVKMSPAVGSVGAQGSLMVNAGLQDIQALNQSLLAQVQRGY